jgi:hypothetical protein
MITSIEEGDLVVVKNVPDGKSFTIVKVTGPYEYHIDNNTGDFGHILPVTGHREFNKLANMVPARLASALDRARRRIIPTIRHADTVVALYERSKTSDEMKPEELRSRLVSWRQKLIPHLKAIILEDLRPESAEQLIEILLKQRGIVVDVIAGPNERGADMLGTVSFASLEGLSFRVAIQVKKHDGVENETNGLDQLERALSEHRVDACMLVSFADELGDRFDKRLKALQQKHNVEVLYGNELYSELLDLIVDRNESGLDV